MSPCVPWHPLAHVVWISVYVFFCHYGDVITGTKASQFTSLTIVYWTAYSDADERKHQSPASLAFVRGIHWGPVNSRHKWPATRKIFPFDGVIMCKKLALLRWSHIITQPSITSYCIYWPQNHVRHIVIWLMSIKKCLMWNAWFKTKL